MTASHLLRTMVEDEQQDFAALLRGLTTEQWTAPSLCQGWSVRDVVIHIAGCRSRLRVPIAMSRV